MLTDPSGFLPQQQQNAGGANQQPTIVKVQNTSRDELNGQLGIVLQYSADRGRYTIHMVNSQTSCALKPDNLTKAGMIDTYKAQFQQLRNDPRIRQQLTHVYRRAQSMLPAPLKPEYVLGGMALLLVLCLYFIGFSKTLMIVSIIMLVGVLIAPDIIEPSNVNWRTVAMNFPRRCRETMEQTVPFLKGKVTNKIAAGIVVMMLLLSTKVIFTSTPTKMNRTAPPPSSSSSRSSSSSSIDNRANIEAAYKWGFDDAKNDNEFGASLPPYDYASKVNENGDNDFEDDEINYDYISSSSPPSSNGVGGIMSKFGIGQGMSIFYMYRTAMSLGSNGAGGFSPEVLMANAKKLPVWQLGIFGFSLFNLLRPFF